MLHQAFLCRRTNKCDGHRQNAKFCLGVASSVDVWFCDCNARLRLLDVQQPDQLRRDVGLGARWEYHCLSVTVQCCGLDVGHSLWSRRPRSNLP